MQIRLKMSVPKSTQALCYMCIDAQEQYLQQPTRSLASIIVHPLASPTCIAAFKRALRVPPHARRYGVYPLHTTPYCAIMQHETPTRHLCLYGKANPLSLGLDFLKRQTFHLRESPNSHNLHSRSFAVDSC